MNKYEKFSYRLYNIRNFAPSITKYDTEVKAKILADCKDKVVKHQMLEQIIQNDVYYISGTNEPYVLPEKRSIIASEKYQQFFR